MTQKSFDGDAVAAKLTAGINSIALSFTVDVTTGWPTTPTNPFVVSVGRGTASEEKVLCDSRSGTTVTINPAGRGYDGTTASSHVAGEDVAHEVDAATLTDLMGHVYDDTRDDHGQYIRTDGTRAFTATGALVAAPVASAVGDTAATGTASTLANSGHRHARESFGAPSASAPGDVQATGAGTSVANSAHVHAREAFGAPVGLGAANAAGAAATVARSDHVHKGGVIIGATSAVVTTPAEGDAVAETSTDRLVMYSGTAFVRIGHFSPSGRTGCTLERSSFSLPTGTPTNVAWSSETFDSDGFIVANGANTIITVPAGLGGLYDAAFNGTFAVAPTARAFVTLLVNGLGGRYYRYAIGMEDVWGGGFAGVPLLAGDTVLLTVFQSNGVAVNTTAHLDFYRVAV